MDTKYDSWKVHKSDEQLAEIIKMGDEEEQNLAIQILRDNYQARLFSFMYQKLPYDWVEDAVQDTWMAVYKKIRVEGIRKAFTNLLFTIAWNKRADTARKLIREKNIESDIPWIDNVGDVQKGLTVRSVEELVIEREQLQIGLHLPFLISKLSDCERVIFSLRKFLEYDVSVIARIMGKTRGTIYTSIYNVNSEIRKYISDGDQELDLEVCKLRKNIWFPSQRKTLIVERFSCPVIPQLNLEEQRLSGIKFADIQDRFIISPFLVQNADNIDAGEPSKFHMLLSERSALERRSKLMNWHISRRKNNKDYNPANSKDAQNVIKEPQESKILEQEILELTRSEQERHNTMDEMDEILLSVEFCEGNIVLKPKSIIQVQTDPWAELYSPCALDNTGMYIGWHGSRSMIPIARIFVNTLSEDELMSYIHGRIPGKMGFECVYDIDDIMNNILGNRQSLERWLQKRQEKPWRPDYIIDFVRKETTIGGKKFSFNFGQEDKLE